MPHSSGGGSSRGGSHRGGSHRGSSSSRNSNPKFGNRYYPGSHRYVYYVNRRPVYYFSDEPYTRQTAESEKKMSIIMGAIFTAIIIPILLVIILSAIHIPHKVSTDYNTEIIIQDDIDVLSNDEESKLRKSFSEFFDETGITPSFISVGKSDWSSSANTLELYAYHKYVDMFADEKHWLVVYTSNGDRESWEWEGMIGDDCGSMITPSLEDAFTKEVQENLWASSRFTVESAISTAFADIAKKAQHISLSGDLLSFLIPIGTCLFFLITFISVLVKGVKMDPDADPRIASEQCKTDKETPREIKCEYCGGIYVLNSKYTCPHCGAAVQSSSD